MKLYGNETARVESSELIIKIGKYRLYRVQLATHRRYFLVDYEIHPLISSQHSTLKRITNNLFISIGSK